ncbi:SpoIIE family protein phosphatase [Streptomyces sp. NPDC057638]|uniref:SpoIIE family protein phosphatase n=1 Tax=Streptomyces sp. NPDC057638 TaxID=3346190 RepID=UPI0036B8428B
MSGFQGSSGETPSSTRRARRAAHRRSGAPPSLLSLLSLRSVVGQLFVLQLVVVMLLALGAVLLLIVLAHKESTQEAGSRSLAMASGFANAPGVAPALDSPHTTALLQPRAEAAREQGNVDFVVVVGRDGLRYTHPQQDRIGQRSSADIARLLAGETIVEERVGTLGPQVRAYVPVKRADGTIAGAVGAGVTIASVSNMAEKQLPLVIGAAVGAVLITTAGAALLSRRLLRQTHGMGPAEITRMYDHHDAVLHSVREGVVIVDPDRRLIFANDEAYRLLELRPGAEGRRVAELGLPSNITELLASGREATDEVHHVSGRPLAVNQRATEDADGPRGTVTTLRDSTELLALTGAAEAARWRLKVLYDASVRIGTTLEVPYTAQELADTVVPRFADYATVDLATSVLRGEEPSGGDGELRRVALAAVRDDHPLFRAGSTLRFELSTPQARGLTEGRAIMVPDLRADTDWQSPDLGRGQRLLDHGIHSLIAAPLTARGAVLGVASLWRSRRPEPFEEDDLALAEEVAARAAVCIDNARRYTREHTMAVTLQRSLMPRGLPAQSALEVAQRYVPARAGVGGDWFDVIPLPGARVALVVGDVVGQGLHAAATMGRLRTAVQNFSALDLPPDEILTHLDELVDRMDQERTADNDSPDVTGASCLYAIYDPVTGDCSVARAGHPPPAVAEPDGTVRLLDVPASPPLGACGGLPIETVELRLAEGSRLVLYTDGLVNHNRDIDTGLGLLRQALTGTAGMSAEETCQRVLRAVLPEDPADDVALLVARTRLLDPDQVAEWEVPSDPAAVAPVRNACAERLETWGLAETAFTTELILSELITNAIRYAVQPIRVRLVRDRSLICEVSDGSSTSPHLRRAAITDEGGRGLFLVAQLADRWGTRYTSRGKVIWTEQTLHPASSAPPPLSTWDL